MNTDCPSCQAPIIVEAQDTIFDEQRYAAQCPLCKTQLIARATVVITYKLIAAELEDGVPIEYCDDSVDVRMNYSEALDRLRKAGLELNPQAVDEIMREAGVCTEVKP